VVAGTHWQRSPLGHGLVVTRRLDTEPAVLDRVAAGAAGLLAVVDRVAAGERWPGVASR
jgi:hypothetical protein